MILSENPTSSKLEMVCLFSIYKLKQYETIGGDCMKNERIIYSESEQPKNPFQRLKKKKFTVILK